MAKDDSKDSKASNKVVEIIEDENVPAPPEDKWFA